MAAGATYGVATGASLHAVKVLKDDGKGSTSSSYEALDSVARNRRPAVSNLSLGGPYTQGYQTAVDSTLNAAVTIVVAAGNNGADACDYAPAYLSSVRDVITVGGTDINNRRYTDSNVGRCVNIWAPGVSIRSAHSDSDTSSVSRTGTSMACPHVSGVAALLLESSPNMVPGNVRNSLISTAARNMITGLTGSDQNRFLQVWAQLR